VIVVAVLVMYYGYAGGAGTVAACKIATGDH